jgi:Uma2 family endonuclease
MVSTRSVPLLCAGDRLTRDEFERRYAAMPHCKKAELIEGVVYMPSPVNATRHGIPHALLVTWLGHYAMRTPAVSCADNTTVRLDLDNEPQPDVLLRLLPGHGGRSQLGPEGYVEGPPELVVEVTASRASYDLHDKLEVYRRSGVREYLVFRVDDAEVDWFVLEGGRYERLPSSAPGTLRGRAFPGLWLDVPALLRGDAAALIEGLDAGLASDEHARFVAPAGPRE